MIVLDSKRITAGLILATAGKNPVVNQLFGPERINQAQLDRLIREDLNQTGGLARIAAAMATPIRSQLNYASLARQFLQVRALASGEEAIEPIRRDPNNHLHLEWDYWAENREGQLSGTDGQAAINDPP